MVKIILNIDTQLDSEHLEELEDIVANAIQTYGVEGEVYNNGTGNSVKVIFNQFKIRNKNGMAKRYKENIEVNKIEDKVGGQNGKL